jgi:hypothetical protein
MSGSVGPRRQDLRCAGMGNAPSFSGTQGTRTLSPFAGITLADPDFGANETATIMLSGGDLNGTLSGSGVTKTSAGTYLLTAGTPAAVTAILRAAIFTPTIHEIVPGGTVSTVMTLSVSDGIASAVTATTTIVATAQNTAPTITGLPATESGTDAASLNPFSATAVTDPDTGAATSASITLTSGGVATDADGLLSGTGLTKTGTGTYTLAATTPGSLSTELQALSFAPTAHQGAPGSSVTTSFGLIVAEGTATTSASTTLTATAQNTAPTITGLSAIESGTDAASLNPFSATTVTDPDTGAATSASITLTSGGVATDADGIVSGTGLTKTGAGTYTLGATTPTLPLSPS